MTSSRSRWTYSVCSTPRWACSSSARARQVSTSPDERRHLSVALLDGLPELDDVDEVVHREQAQSADGVGAVRLVDGLGLEEGLGQPLLAPTHEVERWDVVLDLERGRLGCG